MSSVGAWVARWMPLGVLGSTLLSPSACTSRDPEPAPRAEDRAPPPATKALQVSASHYNACVRFDNGTVSCWGRCTMGCGLRSPETSTGLTTIAGVSEVVDVAVGDSFACAAQGDGQVRCWGGNYHGTLGRAGVDWVASPVPVEGVEGAVEVEASQSMACARTREGQVWAWGGTRDASPPRVLPEIEGATGLWSDPWSCCARLPDDSFACIREGEAQGVRRRARGGDCGCALDPAGTLRCEMHDLPGPPTADGTHPEPQRSSCSIERVDDVRDFVITGPGGYAIRGDGELWRWGGVGQRASWTELARMTSPTEVRSIATGGRGAMFAVDEAGALWGWGWSHEHGITEADGWVEAPVKIWAPPQ